MPRRKVKRIVKKKKTNLKTWLLTILIMLTTGFGCYYYYFVYRKEKFIIERSDFLKSIPEGYQSVGLDISHHQGNIDFERLFVKEGYDTLISWVYIKASEGQDFTDPKFNKNRKELNDLGIPNGAYHFFNPLKPPRPQAAHFMKVWKAREIDLPPVLDVETQGFSDADLIDKMHIWLTVVESETGLRPIIYTSLNFYETKFKGKFPSHQFWIAAYNREPKRTDPQIVHWQYSESGRLPGIREKVDLNVSKLN